MTINFNTKQIEMNKKESKEASKYDSETYRQLLLIRKDFPDYNIVVNSVSHKGCNKGNSYDKMKLYVNAHGTDEQKEQFNSMLEAAKETKGSNITAYREIKGWFDDTFPEAFDFSAAMARITNQKAG